MSSDAQKRIKLLRDFSEDKRISMDVYADYIANGLEKDYRYKYAVSEYVPNIPSRYRALSKIFNLEMRLARYRSYPSQIRKFDSDLFHIIEHGYAHLIKENNIRNRTIITVHDLIPMLQWEGLIDGMESIDKKPRLSAYSLSWLHSAKKIIAISENTKTDLMRLLGLNPNKIEVIYYGIGEVFKVNHEESKDNLRKKLNLPQEKKLILIVGDDPYKNHRNCLKVLELVEAQYKKPIQIVRLGKYESNWEEIKKEFNLTNEVFEINNGLSQNSVCDLYNAVDLLLFPSFYEGFGRPPLEAMACGLPVVTSNRASLPEIIGNAAPMHHPEDIYSISESVLSILEDKNIADDFIQKGLENTKRFSWKENIEKTTNLYDEILTNNKELKDIAYFHRNYGFYGSIELYFSGVRKFLSSNYNYKIYISKFPSRGLFRRIYNIFEAFFYQGDINHVTGDVHFLTYLFSKKKTILSIMDCGSVIHSSGIRRTLYKLLWFTIPAMKADLITVISEKTKKELLSIINYPSEKIHVIPVCLNTEFNFKTNNNFNKIKPTIMHIGTATNKNLSRVVEAIKNINCHLDIIGRLDEVPNELNRIKEYNIDYSSYFALEQKQLVEKYSETDILVFVSTYEGFGVPILEAQSMGIPVITSNISPMIEVSGGCAVLVNPYEVEEIKNAINKIINDDAYRENLIQKGIENAKKYHPENIAGMFEDIYSKF